MEVREIRLRLFVAVPVPEPIAERAFALLPGDLVALRRVRPEQMHLTLAFVGATPVEQVAGVAAAAREAGRELRPFAVGFDRLGGFPGRRAPHTIWLGVGTGATTVEELARRVRRELAARGIAFDRRPARPHLTLARLRSATSDDERRTVAAALDGVRVPAKLAYEAGTLAVVESTLTARGPRYALRATIPLGADA